jgi:hypothetical protein
MTDPTKMSDVEWVVLLLGAFASVVGIAATLVAVLKWNRMMKGLAGKYKHWNDGVTGPEMNITLKPARFHLRGVFTSIRGEMVSGRGCIGKWHSNMSGTSLVLRWGQAIIRAHKTGEGVFEGYHVAEQEVTKNVVLKKIADWPLWGNLPKKSV